MFAVPAGGSALSLLSAQDRSATSRSSRAAFLEWNRRPRSCVGECHVSADSPACSRADLSAMAHSCIPSSCSGSNFDSNREVADESGFWMAGLATGVALAAPHPFLAYAARCTEGPCACANLRDCPCRKMPLPPPQASSSDLDAKSLGKFLKLSPNVV